MDDFSVSPLGTEKTHKLFQHKLFGPHPRSPFWAPRNKFMYLISWEGTQKRHININFFGGSFGVKKGVPNGPSSATKSLVDCFFS